MKDRETGEQAETFFGDKLYQQRAKEALPLLVRQAKAQKPIFYSDLAAELGMRNPRNLNFVLGSVGKSLLQLGKRLGEDIPPIQCLVVNRSDGLPGEGVGFFIDKNAFKAMSTRQRRIVVEAQLHRIYTYPKWDDILTAFSLPLPDADFSAEIEAATRGGRGGGESEPHKRLKTYIAQHPELVGLPASTAQGVNEYALPSGDEVDVLFRRGVEWIGVEVKSDISDDGDLVRGMYQCVKYQAVIEALLLSTNRTENVRTVLVSTRPLPPKLVPLKHVLGVEVISVEPPSTLDAALVQGTAP